MIIEEQRALRRPCKAEEAQRRGTGKGIRSTRMRYQGSLPSPAGRKHDLKLLCAITDQERCNYKEPRARKGRGRQEAENDVEGTQLSRTIKKIHFFKVYKNKEVLERKRALEREGT